MGLGGSPQRYQQLRRQRHPRRDADRDLRGLVGNARDLSHFCFGSPGLGVLLRLEGADALPTAALGDSDTARVGQWVLAVGSPIGIDQTPGAAVSGCR